MKYFILDASVGIGEGGFACGPVDGPVIAEVHLRQEDNSETYFLLAEVTGIPNFYQTDHSTFELQLEGDLSEDFIDELNEHFIDTGDYEEIFDVDDELPEYYDILRYLIYLVRCSKEDEESFIQATVGKWLDDIEVPVSDLEKRFRNEYDD